MIIVWNLFVEYIRLFAIMSKQAFEQANEVFVDDKYEEAYEVCALKTDFFIIPTLNFII